MPTQLASISAPLFGSGTLCPPEYAASGRSDRLAALAELSLAHQRPTLFLPRIEDAPSVRSMVEGSIETSTMAASLAALGLGDAALWSDVSGNPASFIRMALKRWISELGADELDTAVDYHLEVADNHDVGLSDAHGQLFFSITLGGCGVLRLGKILRALEAEEHGLGKSFYAALCSTLNRWVRTFDLYEADRWVEYAREGAMDELDPDSNLSEEEQWNAMGIVLPDLYAQVPADIRVPLAFDRRKDLRILKRHADGQYGSMITSVLEMEAIRPEPRNPFVADLFEQGLWESQTLPAWLIHFEAHDTVLQAFDEECMTYNETSSEPAWLGVFVPSNAKQLAASLTGLQKFLQINIKTAQLKAAIESWENENGRLSQHRHDDGIRSE